MKRKKSVCRLAKQDQFVVSQFCIFGTQCDGCFGHSAGWFPFEIWSFTNWCLL